MRKKIATFSSISFFVWVILIEAVFWLALMRFLLLLLPFRYLAKLLGVAQIESSKQENSAEQVIVLDNINHQLARASRRVPWECKCLVKAIAGMMMLYRRRLAATLYLGVARDSAAKLSAHAWLRSGDFILCGGESAHEFTIIASFSHSSKWIS